MKKTIIILILLSTLRISAQDKPRYNSLWSIDYTTEGLYNASNGRANWINIFDAEYRQELPHNFMLSVNLLSVNNVRTSQGRGGVTEGMHIFSRTEAESVPLSLFVFGLSKKLGAFNLFLGVRNLNVDYFTTPWNSIFTSSVNRLYPCIAASYPTADTPYSAMALQADVDITPKLLLRASLYNGVASYKWDEVFRFRPQRDGVMLISELSYKGSDKLGNYHVGAIWGNSYQSSLGRKAIRRTLWVLAEQPLWRGEAERQVELVVHGGISPKSDCDGYFGLGGVWRGITEESDYLGLMFTRALHIGGNETACEITYAYPIGRAKLQTALHYVHAPERNNWIGILKVVFDFGTARR